MANIHELVWNILYIIPLLHMNRANDERLRRKYDPKFTEVDNGRKKSS